MKSKRNLRHGRKSRRNRKSRRKLRGGFTNFFSKNQIIPSEECNVNNLSTLSKDMGDGQDPLTKMRANYQKCCPKETFGRENSSPYCKQLKMNFDSQYQYKKDITGYHGDETDVSKIREVMQAPMAPKKPWYKFWGGKTRKNTRRHRK
jgi:hypothetical protein